KPRRPFARLSADGGSGHFVDRDRRFARELQTRADDPGWRNRSRSSRRGRLVVQSNAAAAPSLVPENNPGESPALPRGIEVAFLIPIRNGCWAEIDRP